MASSDQTTLDSYLENMKLADAEDGEEEEEEEGEEERIKRMVIFGRIDLTVKAGLAHHWAIKLVECPHDAPCLSSTIDSEATPEAQEYLNAEGNWFEVDGFQMDDPKNLKHNSINGSDDYQRPGEHTGIKSRLNSVPEVIVGQTNRTNEEIYIFNCDYLSRNFRSRRDCPRKCAGCNAESV